MGMWRPFLDFFMAPRKLLDQEKVRQRVLELYHEGKLGYEAIGKDPGVQRSKSTVQSIIKAFKDRSSVADRPRTGRPSALTKRYQFLHEL